MSRNALLKKSKAGDRIFCHIFYSFIFIFIFFIFHFIVIEFLSYPRLSTCYSRHCTLDFRPSTIRHTLLSGSMHQHGFRCGLTPLQFAIYLWFV